MVPEADSVIKPFSKILSMNDAARLALVPPDLARSVE